MISGIKHKLVEETKEEISPEGYYTVINIKKYIPIN